VKDPQEALAAARRAAAGQAGASSPPRSPDDASASMRRLVEWAIIEPDDAEVYSTRPYGAPITAIKRVLIRLLRQYLDQVSAQQSRFNAHVAAHVVALEARIRALEDAAAERSGEDPPTT
jgi:hypothetical protein